MNTIETLSMASLATLLILIAVSMIDRIKKGIRLQSSLQRDKEVVALLLKCRGYKKVSGAERKITIKNPRYFDHGLFTVKISHEGERFLKSYREAILLKKFSDFAKKIANRLNFCFFISQT